MRTAHSGFRCRGISQRRNLPLTVARALVPGSGGAGCPCAVSGSVAHQLCGSAGSLSILFCKNRSCGNRMKPLEGAGKEWAPRGTAFLLALELLLLNHLLCLSCVSGPGWHAWAARISSKYHSNRLCTQQLCPPWSLHLEHCAPPLCGRTPAPSCS